MNIPKKELVLGIALGLLYALFLSLGLVINSPDVSSWASGNKVLFVLLVAVLAAALSFLVIKGWGLLARVSEKASESAAPRHFGASPDADAPRRPFVKLFGLLLLCWSPYVLLCLPGSNCVDFFSQIAQWVGVMPFTAHHPPFMSAVFGVLWQLGNAVGGPNVAQLFNLVFQVVCFAACIACSLRLMQEFRPPKKVFYALVAFYALCPIVPLYAQWCIKNTIAAGVMLLFVTQVAIRVAGLFEGEDVSAFVRRAAGVPALVALGLLCCLTRNDGVYVVLATLLLCLLKDVRVRGRAKAWLCCGGCILAGYMAWTLLVLPVAGIKGGSVREMLSVPLQQIAHCAEVHPEFYEGERGERLEGLLKDGYDTRTVAEGFRTFESDYVKMQFAFDSGDDVPTLLSIWLETLAAFPADCIKTLCVTTVGYWSPFMDNSWYFGIGTSYLSFTTEVGLTDEEGIVHEFRADGLHVFFPTARELVQKAVGKFVKVPVLRLFARPAFYVWITLFLCGFVLARKSRLWPVCIPSALVFCICCISPVNGELRYVLPLVLIVPLLAAIACGCEGRTEGRGVKGDKKGEHAHGGFSAN